MSDEDTLTLREIGGARGDIYGVADEIETVKLMLRRLPSRAYLCRTIFMAAAPIWALLGVLLLLR
jgi:hypothetical protein